MIAPVLPGEQTVEMASQQGHVSERTVERWLKRFQEKGFDGLQPRRRKDWQTTKADNGRWNYVLVHGAAFSLPEIPGGKLPLA